MTQYKLVWGRFCVGQGGGCLAEMAPAFGGLLPWLVLLFSRAGLQGGGRSALGRQNCNDSPLQVLLGTDHHSVCVRNADVIVTVEAGVPWVLVFLNSTRTRLMRDYCRQSPVSGRLENVSARKWCSVNLVRV